MLPLARTVFVAALCLVVPLVQAADDATTVLAPDAARADFELAVDVVEAALPNPYWFQTRRAWRAAKAHARRALRDARDGEALFRVLRPLLSGIGEGHLTLRRSDAMRRRDRIATGLVPVDVHWTEAGAFVTAGYGEAADIARGTRLVAIDGEPVDRLVDELAAALGHDGQIRTGATLASFADNMAMEYALGGRVVQTHDFQEGVRAVIVDKDNAPQWSPADLPGVTNETLDALFAPLPADQAWSPL